MFTNGPSVFIPRVFPIALNGPTRSWKGGIDAHEWAQCFTPEIVSNCFERAHRIMQRRHQYLRIGHAPVGPFKAVESIFGIELLAHPRTSMSALHSPVGPFKAVGNILERNLLGPSENIDASFP
jgi:hypothetical protein